jgi:hypothetical protein
LSQKSLLKFWFEWKTGTAFWSGNDLARKRFDSYPIDPRLLPLSPGTVERVFELSRWHDTALNWEYPPDPGPWREDECKRFNQAVTELFETAIRELGDEFEILNVQGEEHEDPELDAYLHNPKTFRRKS